MRIGLIEIDDKYAESSVKAMNTLKQFFREDFVPEVKNAIAISFDYLERGYNSLQENARKINLKLPTSDEIKAMVLRVYDWFQGWWYNGVPAASNSTAVPEVSATDDQDLKETTTVEKVEEVVDPILTSPPPSPTTPSIQASVTEESSTSTVSKKPNAAYQENRIKLEKLFQNGHKQQETSLEISEKQEEPKEIDAASTEAKSIPEKLTHINLSRPAKPKTRKPKKKNAERFNAMSQPETSNVDPQKHNAESKPLPPGVSVKSPTAMTMAQLSAVKLKPRKNLE